MIAQHTDWNTIPIERVADGIERQMIWGERLMVCRLRFAPGTITAVHTHVHEQITLVEQGRVEFTIGPDPHRFGRRCAVLPITAQSWGDDAGRRSGADRYLLAATRGLPEIKKRGPALLTPFFMLRGRSS